MLNRAPTLHRLSIQAFEPVLIEGKAIQLHPLVCTAFNADFDGDQMAVHVPLSLEAQLEARVLMMSTNNILSPASGKPIVTPTKDMVLGMYYLTLALDKEPGEGMVFGSIDEINNALYNNVVSLHAKIKARYNHVNQEGKVTTSIEETTPGRMLLSEILPHHDNIKFSLINRLIRNKELSEIVSVVYRWCGQKETVIFVDRVKDMGFYYSTKSGTSFGKNDILVPDSKAKIIADTQKVVEEFERQYRDGLITQGEKYNKVVDSWAHCSDKVANEMVSNISKIEPGVPVNSIWMLAHSGARGSTTQIRQLAGMRGLMAKPNGEIIETPIISNFREGLNVLEYFNSTHGARKGLSDTALKTASAGYLTRRLVDVAQDAIITEDDCGTERGVYVTATVDGGNVLETLAEKILGRTIQEDVISPESGEVLFKKGALLGEDECEVITKHKVEKIFIRSVLTCESKEGICAKCYGRDLARSTPVNIGEAVGIIAAQSIGEPGTQLTMRTFHIGGAAQKGSEKSSQESSFDGILKLSNRNVVKNSEGSTIVMSRNCDALICDKDGNEKVKYRIPYGARLLIELGSEVVKGDKIAEWDPYTRPIITEKEGKIKFVDLIETVSVNEVTDESTGLSSKIIIDWRSNSKRSDLKPSILLLNDKGDIHKLSNGLDARYLMSVGAILSVEDGQEVNAGDVIARIPRESSKSKDITGGLPRVTELFEARRPKDYALIAEIDGRVEFGKDYKTKQSILLIGEDGTQVEYLVQKGKALAVSEGDSVKKGDFIIEGALDPHDILRVQGVEALAQYIVKEVQAVYLLQGVKIADKHIEVIARQMLQKVEIMDAGDTTFLVNEHVSQSALVAENERVLASGGRVAEAKPVLLGITRASLQTDSFISAASFQETTRVLTEAAVEGKKDNLNGLKENVIVGRLIPAGTGAYINRLKAIQAAQTEAIEADKPAEESVTSAE
jgi:DNA-directed RNA polymerase subunit beta'